jgi:uncharacterized protein DUF992
MRNVARASAGLATIMLAAGISGAGAQPVRDVGRLTCGIGPGVGVVVGSSRRANCRFEPNDRGRVDSYSGRITRVGLDIGATAGGTMTWMVFSRRRDLPPGALAGRYVGVSADASLGLGAGAKVLVGGVRRSVRLQPIAVMGQVGLNVAAGISGLTLRFNSPVAGR